MIQDIDRKDIDALNFTCALSGYTVNYYTIEQNALMIRVEITDRSGRPLTLTDAWMLGRLFESRISTVELSNIKTK